LTFIQKFSEAKILYRKIAKEFNIKNPNDWNKFVKTKDFKQYKNLLPKNPEVYYSKKNVIKRMGIKN